MDSQYGNIYINFDYSFSLQNYIRDIHANGNDNQNHIVSTLAHEIIYR